MSPTMLLPSSRWRTKRYVMLGAIGVAGFAGAWLAAALMLAVLAGAGTLGTSFIVALLATAAWLIPAVLLVPQMMRSLCYEIVDDELLLHGGIITYSEVHIPLNTITTLEVRRDLLDRWLGLGTLVIHTEQRDMARGAWHMAGLADVQAVYKQVNTVIDARHRDLLPARIHEVVDAVSVLDGPDDPDATLPAIDTPQLLLALNAVLLELQKQRKEHVAAYSALLEALQNLPQPSNEADPEVLEALKRLLADVRMIRRNIE